MLCGVIPGAGIRSKERPREARGGWYFGEIRGVNISVAISSPRNLDIGGGRVSGFMLYTHFVYMSVALL
jgi:hypothetical protein